MRRLGEVALELDNHNDRADHDAHNDHDLHRDPKARQLIQSISD
jgi:hypothetical protein